MLLNTIKEKESEGGLTFVELQQDAQHVPSTRIYRLIKKMHEDGLLDRKEEEESERRPKYFYTLTKLGNDELEALKDRIDSLLKEVKLNFPRWLDAHLSRAICQHGCIKGERHNPVLHIIQEVMKRPLSNEEKLEELKFIEKQMERNLKEGLQMIQKLKEELQK
ncbi:MAG: helix-turn-helix transcriptional regulator [Candidatus Hodarchaeota archaeon]